MRKMYAPSGFLAVEPFPSQAIEKTVVNGILQTRVKSALTKLKLIATSLEDENTYSDKNVTHVYLPGDYNVSTIYGRNVYSVEGVRYILVPAKDVLALTDET